jgi:spermidine synthase
MTKPYSRLLTITAFITGATILVIELMGTRLMAPFFGSGIYTWSAMIAITMAALALGYAFGGHLSDRFGESRWLFMLILLAAIWTAFTPFIASQFIPAILPALDLRLSVLISSTVLFFPSLFLLATVCPFVIRLLTRQKEEVGRRSGHVFAISTIGSLFGALFSGFYLMPNVGVGSTFLVSAFVLSMLVLMGTYLGRYLREIVISTLIAILIGVSMLARSPANYADIKIIERSTGFYGQIQIIEKYNTRVMLVDGIGQNYVVTNARYSVPYINFVSAIPGLHRPENNTNSSALVIGLGAGEVPMRFKSQGIMTDVVEIDPTIARLAKKYFQLELPPSQIHIMDGRQYAMQTTQLYDYLFIDAFSADQIASHLFSLEALSLFKQRLKNDGLLIINITSELAGKDVAAVHTTLKQLYSNVHTYAHGILGELASHILLAGNIPIDWHIEAKTNMPVELHHVSYFLSNELTGLERQLVLRDDFNPLTEMRTEVALKWRVGTWEFLGKDNLGWLIY